MQENFQGLGLKTGASSEGCKHKNYVDFLSVKTAEVDIPNYWVCKDCKLELEPWVEIRKILTNDKNS